MKNKTTFEEVQILIKYELETLNHNDENSKFLYELRMLYRQVKIAILFDDKVMCDSITEQWISRFEGYWLLIEDIEYLEEDQ